MSRSSLRRIAPAILLAVGLTACATDDTGTPAATDGATTAPTATEAPTAGATEDASAADDTAAFPATVTDDAGEVTIDQQPQAIVSLSPTATEMLFAIGAGDQVVAVDEFSTFPPEAPVTDLSGFTPNLEAVLAFEPDLVVIQNDTNDLVAGLTEVGVPVLQYGSAPDLDTASAQFEGLGAATGHPGEAEQVVADVRSELDDLVASADTAAGSTYYHELSADLFTATSSTFIGEVYGLFGLENIADAADTDATGYPQLSAEYLVDQDPDLVFLACTVFCGETAETFCARDPFVDLTACAEGNVVELDDDVASRWGPRVVEFAQDVAGAVGDG